MKMLTMWYGFKNQSVGRSDAKWECKPGKKIRKMFIVRCNDDTIYEKVGVHSLD